MIKLLLPRQLVNRPSAPDEQRPFAQALPQAFERAYPLLRRAAMGSLPISLFGLLPSIFVLQVYDRVISRSATATLVALVAGIFCFLGVEYFLRARRSRALRNAGATIDHQVSGALLASLMRRPLRVLEARPTSAWLMLFRDVSAVRGTVTGGLMSAIFDLPMALFALIVIGIVAWPVLPVVLVFLGLMAFLAWWWADEVRAGRVEETARARDLDRIASEICRARETIKTLGQDAPVTELWRRSYDDWLTESFRKNGELENAREASTVLLTVFSVLAVTAGALAVTDQLMTVGSLMAVNMLAIKALSPVAGLATNWRLLARASEAAQRLETVLSEPVERADSGLNLPKPTGRLLLADVSFTFHENARPVFEGLNLQIGPTGLHVIVGRNGAGKSTLAKLLSGLYTPTKGQVRLDEYDLAQFSRGELAPWVSTLSQEVYWFSGPLIDTLRRTAPGQTDEQIFAACRLSGAHEFIARLPDGYHTEVGEGGAGLSVGERRKLALAQLFLRQPAVLVLDEPSNDLDFASEAALIAALSAVARQRTVIVVTHSLRLVSAATQIYHVRGDGQVEQGPPAAMVPRLFGVQRPLPAALPDMPSQAGVPA
ncbi:peptidase domain-containing ABC transporter [Hydrogenophaga electricum]|uniref:ABC transporter n=1 Tax=Hydrogenophaga electricum TaxID=1230953 RepID=A0ABQ6C3J2_9BURK|nr:ATP-binding cassette domain-containing protein [Hydrogenophaga electricum]GLS14495.1 hypothetical protein GCM10007935_19260 [Hydrogenophaga electricum]